MVYSCTKEPIKLKETVSVKEKTEKFWNDLIKLKEERQKKNKRILIS